MTAQYDAGMVDELSAFFLTRDAPVNWTPVVTQTVNVTVTVNRATYQVQGKWVHIMCNLVVTGAGTAGTAIEVSGWPAAILALNPGTYGVAGIGGVFDNGANVYDGFVFFYGAITSVRFYWQPSGNYIGVNPNFALANTDEIYMNCNWEIG
jgi:photosystem II stability/assembly factor-like uncharacterized protein